MRTDFFPDREADMLAWSSTFAEKIAVDGESLGLPQSMIDAFIAAQSAFAQAYAVAMNPSTRTTPAVQFKNQQRRAMESLARSTAAMIRANPAVSNQQRYDLGLSVRVGRAAPLKAPQSPPIVRVTEVVGQTITLELRDAESPDRRARPRTAAGVSIFTFIGHEPPVDVNAWYTGGSYSGTTPRLTLPGVVAPFTQVWITARWYSPRGEPSAASVPITTHTQVAGPMMSRLRAA